MRRLLFVLIFCCSLLNYSQNYSGIATYKSFRESEIPKGFNKDGKMAESNKSRIKYEFNKLNQQTFLLSFNSTESLYKKEEKLEKPNKKGKLVFTIIKQGDDDTYYKNIKQKIYARNTYLLGKLFLVEDKLPDYKWELTNEKKNIGLYTSYKAICKKNNTDNEYITAWYTPEIPISNGPANYGGLPGLILEITDDKIRILCTEIKIDQSKSLVIKKLKKGKSVSQKEFQEIKEEKKNQRKSSTFFNVGG